MVKQLFWGSKGRGSLHDRRDDRGWILGSRVDIPSGTPHFSPTG